MSDPARSTNGGAGEAAPKADQSEAARPGVQLVRLPVEKPQAAVAFLHMRGEGVMDLIAHFWERLSQTPPLQRGDLHLVVATTGTLSDEDIIISRIDAGRFSGAMLYVPKAHRADVLALDPQTASAFAAYICHQGAKAERSDNATATDAAAGKEDVTSSANNSNGNPARVTLTDLSTGKPNTPVDREPIPETANGRGGNGGPKLPIDFLTGHADGVFWMTPLLLPAVHRKTPARQLVNVVMQLPSSATCHPDANVRLARDSDIPHLNRWRRLYKEERGILFDADFDAWVESQRVFVYEHEKTVVAFAKFDLELPSLIEIGGVYTFPEFRKQGFGAKIVSALACRVRLMGKTPTLQVDEQNVPALRLYENAGWKTMGKLARVWLTG